ncbi:MAG: hypothetical protein QOG86_884, partial [Thermoleophilaceae bacterium]|nr:hypothetical protein [Thermoleophilaceae bacterium]
VVALDVERGLAAAEDADLARLVGLDPDGRLRLTDVAQEGTKDKQGHVKEPTQSAGGAVAPG